MNLETKLDVAAKNWAESESPYQEMKHLLRDTYIKGFKRGTKLSNSAKKPKGRVITSTHTGKIVSDLDLGIEYLYVGDYGKENNIKASFLGYNEPIEEVKHQPVNLSDKLVITVSSQRGCAMKCDFCDCHRLNFGGNLTIQEMMCEITTALSLSGCLTSKRLNLHFARMGEPTFNTEVILAANLVAQMVKCHRVQFFDEYHPVVSTMMPKGNAMLGFFLEEWVLAGYMYGGKDGYGLQFSINTLDEEDRNEMFGGMSLSLAEIGAMINRLPEPKGRKFTLNFAVTSDSNLDPVLMEKYFDKKKCVVKITPIHKTYEAETNGYEIVRDFSVYEKFEKPLVEAGWDVIVFIPSMEEDNDRITCGNALIAYM